MALVFPYRVHPVLVPVWPLHGRPARPRPVVNVGVIGPTGTSVEAALLDTGADDTVFTDALASAIGIDLTNAPTATASAIGIATTRFRYAEVRLRLWDGNELREWPARVAFTSAPLRRGLLGFAGFFQFFTATFDGDREQVELTVNALYPGT